MFSPVKAITAGALVFALGGVLFIAQPFDQQAGSIPGGAQSDERAAEWVTFVEEECTVEGETHTSGSDAGVAWIRDLPLACEVTYSDPRVSGAQSTLYNEDCFGPAGLPCVYWATHELVGPEGTWSGWTNGTTDPERDATGYTVMTGSGDYEGLTFVSHAAGPFGETPTGFGIIFEGDSPPPPMLLE